MFGEPLLSVLVNQRRSGIFEDIPYLVNRCLHHLLPKYGTFFYFLIRPDAHLQTVGEEGLFRVSGNHEDLNNLKTDIDEGMFIITFAIALLTMLDSSSSGLGSDQQPSLGCMFVKAVCQRASYTPHS